MNLTKSITLFGLCTTLPIAANAQTAPTSSPFSFSGSYTADVFNNINGGIDQKTAYIDNLSGVVDFDGSKISMPRLRGSLSAFYSNGATIGDAIGDFQGITNIETGYGGLYLNEAWLEYGFGDARDGEYALRLKGGQIDLNSEFDAPGSSGLFLNGSHGINPAFSQTGENGPSIYPVTGFGTILNARLSDNFTYKIGAFDGSVGNTATPNRPKWHLSSKEGALLVSEFGYSNGALAINIGGFGYTVATDNIDASKKEKNNGYYAQIDINPEGSISGFARFGGARKTMNLIHDYQAIGLVAHNPLGNDGHELGFAIGKANLSNLSKNYLGVGASSETNYELTYLLPITENFSLQGDYQYVKNPSADPNIADASVLGMRLKYSFGN